MDSSDQDPLMSYLGGKISFQDWLSSQEVPNESTRERILESVEDLQKEVVASDQEASKAESAPVSGGLQQIGLRLDDNEALSLANVESDEDSVDGIMSGSTGVEDTVDDDDEEPMSTLQIKTTALSATTSSRGGGGAEFEMPTSEILTMDDSQLSDEQRQVKLMLPIIEQIACVLINSTSREDNTIRDAEPEEVGDGHMAAIRGMQDYKLKRHGGRKSVGCNVPSFRQTKLPELLRLNMGQANLHVAKGEFKQAADICMEIIKEAPNSALPFKLLSFIYEEQGDESTALQYGLLAAHLQCRDPNVWIDLAQRCLRAGDKKQHVTCYDKACKLARMDLPLLWERASLHFMIGDFRKAMDHYANILKVIKPSDVNLFTDVCKSVNLMYQNVNQLEKGCDILASALAICSDDLDMLRTYLDMLISQKEYRSALEAICKFCDVHVPEYMRRRMREQTAATEHKETVQLEDESESTFKELLSSRMLGDFELTSAMTASFIPSKPDDQKTLARESESDANVEDSSYNKHYTDLTAMPTNIAMDSSSVSHSGYTVPDALPIDIRVRLVCMLIHFQEASLELNRVLQPLFSSDVGSVGELYLSVAVAYMDVGMFEDALCSLQDLVVTPKFNGATVWLKIAECYDALGEVDRSEESYRMVLTFDPQRVPVRLSLAAILRSQGRNDEALQVLSEYREEDQVIAQAERDATAVHGTAGKQEQVDYRSSTVEKSTSKLTDDEFELWHRKCMLLYTGHHMQEFIRSGYTLLHNYLRSNFALQKRVTMGKAIMWELLLKFLSVGTSIGEYEKCCSLLETALKFAPYSDSKNYRLDLDYYATTTFLVSGDYSRAFDAFRFLLTHESDTVKHSSTALWNLFAAIVSRMTDRRHHRFTLRFLFKQPHLVPLVVQNGINSHLSGTYKYAIGEFARAFKECPSDPLISLLMAISFLHLSCQKFHTTRHTSILQGMIFIFQYFHLRGENQEACYNVGRAFHQVGLVHFAVHYYNKALEFPLNDEKDDNVDLHDVEYNAHIDLHREAAYNLSLIYKASGNNDLARKILHRYCWV